MSSMTPQMVNAIATLLNALAWPIIVILVVVVFRKPFGELIKSIESFTLKAGGGELGIRRVVEQAADQLIKSDPNAPNVVTPAQMDAAQRVANLTKRSDQPLAWQQMIELAREYESTRASMNPGDARTRRMEVVVTKMRTLGVAAFSYLSELSRSTSAGERLAAIAILQVRADPQYWEWLSERVRDERPFVGYQAAVGLLTAARTSDPGDRVTLEKILKQAKEWLGPDAQDTDRAKVIDTALSELRGSVKTSH
jgi:hypothetical protein